MKKRAAREPKKKPTDVRPLGKAFAIDLETLKGVAEIGGTLDEVAAVLRISKRTLQRYIDDDERIAAAWGEGHGICKVTLRRVQWNLAIAGNPTMLVWLGKQILHQSERLKTESTVTVTDDRDALDALRQEITDTIAASALKHLNGSGVVH